MAAEATMFKIDVAGAEPAFVCTQCLENEDWFRGAHAFCPNLAGGARCSNSTQADAPTGALRNSIRMRRNDPKSRTLYKMVIIPTT